MGEYLLIVLVLALAGACGYLLWERRSRGRGATAAPLFTEALRDLLDGRPESAFGKLRQVVADDPDNLDAYLRLGAILREHAQPERALQVHKDLTVRHGLTREDKVAILRELALDYVALEEYELAQRALDELLSLDNRNRWALARMLDILERRGEWEAAYETAERLLRLESGRPRRPLARYKYQLGRRLLEQQEYHKARLAFKEALGIDPELAEAYVAIGDSYLAEERYEDAVTFWQKLIETVPRRGHLVLERLEKTLFELGRFGDIAEVCERILRDDPRNLPARRTLALFHEKKGDLTSAVEMVESLFDDYPDDPLVLLELTRLYLEQGDQSKITALLRRLEARRAAGTDGRTPPVDSAITSGA